MNSNNPLKARRLSEGSCWNGGEALMWDEQDNRGGGREGRELCERECRALAVSRVICPLISLTVHSTNTFFLSLFRLSSPVPISFYYSLTISISLSSSKAALFWECSIRKRRESRWWFRRQGFWGLVHGVSLLKRVIAIVCENIAFLCLRLKYFPLCNQCRKI